MTHPLGLLMFSKSSKRMMPVESASCLTVSVFVSVASAWLVKVSTASRSAPVVLSLLAKMPTCMVPALPLPGDTVSHCGSPLTCHASSLATVTKAALFSWPFSVSVSSERMSCFFISSSSKLMVSPQADTPAMAKLAGVPSL